MVVERIFFFVEYMKRPPTSGLQRKYEQWMGNSISTQGTESGRSPSMLHPPERDFGRASVPTRGATSTTGAAESPETAGREVVLHPGRLYSAGSAEVQE